MFYNKRVPVQISYSEREKLSSDTYSHNWQLCSCVSRYTPKIYLYNADLGQKTQNLEYFYQKKKKKWDYPGIEPEF